MVDPTLHLEQNYMRLHLGRSASPGQVRPTASIAGQESKVGLVLDVRDMHTHKLREGACGCPVGACGCLALHGDEVARRGEYHRLIHFKERSPAIPHGFPADDIGVGADRLVECLGHGATADMRCSQDDAHEPFLGYAPCCILRGLEARQLFSQPPQLSLRPATP